MYINSTEIIAKEITIMFISFYRILVQIIAQIHNVPAHQDVHEWQPLLTSEVVSTKSRYLLIFLFLM